MAWFIPLMLAQGVISSAVSTATNLFNQNAQRDLYNYQGEGYQRALDDWNKNVGSQGRTIKYPEQSFEGALKARDVGIAQSYSSSIATGANQVNQAAYYSQGLYSANLGKSSRWL